MADLVSYYVETTQAHGPATLFRRRPDAGGGRVDEHLVPTDGTWREHDGLRRYEDGQWDWDFYGIQPDEAEHVTTWLRRAAEVGRDDAGPPPVLGEWSVGRAWLVRLAGPLTEETTATILGRLGMTRRAFPSDWRERDLGLRVLRADGECRWNFELYRASDKRWFLQLVFLRRTPDERVLQELRDQVYPLLRELGVAVVEELTGTQNSFPQSERARRQRPDDEDRLLAVWFRGRMTEAGLRTLHARLGLAAESGGDLDDPVLEWGATNLPNDTRFRAQLRLRREFADEDRWRFEIGLEGARPPEETIARWRDEIMAAAREVALAYESDWLAPRPTHATPAPAPAHASTPVSVLYRAYLDGRFTAGTLDEFRDALGIGRRGRIDDDTEQFFGERVLRDEPGGLVRLMLARTFDGNWYLSLSYQGEPPGNATVERLAMDIHAAAGRAGLAVRLEQHNPPGGGSA